MTLNVVPAKIRNIRDVPSTLRSLADQIEAGDYGDAHSLAWVLDCGNSRIEIGLMGEAESPGVEAHFLYSLAAHKLVTGVLEA